MASGDDGQLEYPNSYAADSRFLNCVLHYAEKRVGTAFSSIDYRATEVGTTEMFTVVLRGQWGRFQKHLRARPPEVWVEEDYEARTCTARDLRVPYFASSTETVIITVPTDKKKPDKQAIKLLDAAQAYLAAIRS